MSKPELQKINAAAPAKDLRQFQELMRARMPSIKTVAARHLNPERIFRIVVACVTRTPALRECSMDSIFRSTVQAAEMGLEPGSAIGEAYLVPYRTKNGMECQLIPGYRGLISLAYRSGHVKSVTAHCVYQGDEFHFELGLAPVLRHIPNATATRDPKDITYAYCVVHLQDGGLLYDVMTRGEIDAIRARSKAGSSSPWVTDYAEMARKTVTRRTLKYAPMSVELQKAIAMDAAAESGETINAEFEALDLPEEAPTPTKTDEIKGKLGVKPGEETEGEPYSGPTVKADEDGVLL